MIEWFIVLSFYAPNGHLQKQVSSNNLHSVEACEQLLKFDIADRMKTFKNVTGTCVAAPVKPSWLPDAQEQPKSKSLDA